MRLVINIATAHLDRDGQKERTLNETAGSCAKAEGRVSFTSESESS